MSSATSQVKIANVESLRLRVAIRGAVQGVGFRPFIYRLATELGLAGWVNNSPQGVFIEVEGDKVRPASGAVGRPGARSIIGSSGAACGG